MNAQDILIELAPIVLRKQREQKSIAALDAMDITMRRCAHEAARETLHHQCGYALEEMNRSDKPADWSQDFREMVLIAADSIEQMENGGQVIRTISLAVDDRQTKRVHSQALRFADHLEQTGT